MQRTDRRRTCLASGPEAAETAEKIPVSWLSRGRAFERPAEVLGLLEDPAEISIAGYLADRSHFDPGKYICAEPDDGLTWAARQKLQPGAIPYYSSGCGRRSPYRPR
jgi:hypothetical protein